MNDEVLEQAVAILRRGGVIAYPTESVYGLGCDPDNEAAIRKLLALKQRSPDKGLILIAADFEQLAPWLADIETSRKQNVLASWPGPVTWLWPAHPTVSRLLRGAHDSLAVRVTAHPLAAQLCRRFGKALVSTSANRSGQPAARNAETVREQFGSELDYVVEAPTGGLARPTTIRDAVSGDVVRKGG